LGRGREREYFRVGLDDAPCKAKHLPRHVPIFERARPDWLVGAALVLKLKSTCDSIQGCVKV
jgi:hypothetical protein